MASRGVPDDDRWADDEWHTDENGQIIGGRRPTLFSSPSPLLMRPWSTRRPTGRVDFNNLRLAAHRRHARSWSDCDVRCWLGCSWCPCTRRTVRALRIPAESEARFAIERASMRTQTWLHDNTDGGSHLRLERSAIRLEEVLRICWTSSGPDGATAGEMRRAR